MNGRATRSGKFSTSYAPLDRRRTTSTPSRAPRTTIRFPGIACNGSYATRALNTIDISCELSLGATAGPTQPRVGEIAEKPLQSNRRASATITVLLLVIGITSACTDSPTGPPPNSRWVGTWNLVSVNGLGLPAVTTVAGYNAHIFSRQLEVWPDTGYLYGDGIWRDSTMAALHCNPPGPPPGTQLCNASGFSVFSWVAFGDTLGFFRGSLYTGYVTLLKTFVWQPDGSLLKTDDSHVEVYRKP